MITPLGRKIRDLRKGKGLTLEELANLADSSKSYIWELENKDPPRPSAEKVAKIAKVLGVTADYLMNKSQKAPDDDVLDAAFFREFKNLKDEDKDRLRDLVKAWGK
ncbi:MAG TPA: helix-turn-helix transcriptional regulator [Steroidobacteraceae bacterium]